MKPGRDRRGVLHLPDLAQRSDAAFDDEAPMPWWRKRHELLVTCALVSGEWGSVALRIEPRHHLVRADLTLLRFGAGVRRVTHEQRGEETGHRRPAQGFGRCQRAGHSLL